NGVSRVGVARLNADGTLDTSFDPGTGADGNIYALTQDAAGNTYVGGSFSYFNGVVRAHLAKLTPTGGLDSTFAPAGNTNGIVYSIIGPDSAGMLVVGGAFSSLNGSTARR